MDQDLISLPLGWATILYKDNSWTIVREFNPTKVNLDRFEIPVFRIGEYQITHLGQNAKLDVNKTSTHNSFTYGNFDDLRSLLSRANVATLNRMVNENIEFLFEDGLAVPAIGSKISKIAQEGQGALYWYHIAGRANGILISFFELDVENDGIQKNPNSVDVCWFCPISISQFFYFVLFESQIRAKQLRNVNLLPSESTFANEIIKSASLC